MLVVVAVGCRDAPPAAPGARALAAEAAPAPPAPATAEARGEALFFGRAGCATCHSIAARGGMQAGPNLGVAKDFPKPFAARASERRPGLTPLEYALESLVDPDAYVVATYAPGVMKRPEEPPISLSDDELVDLASFVASIGAAAPASPADRSAARARLAELRAARAARLAAPPPPAP